MGAGRGQQAWPVGAAGGGPAARRAPRPRVTPDQAHGWVTCLHFPWLQRSLWLRPGLAPSVQ